VTRVEGRAELVYRIGTSWLAGVLLLALLVGLFLG